MSLKSKMASKIYKGDDFPGWKLDMESVLKEKRLWTVVKQGIDGEVKNYLEKHEKDEKKHTWRQHDATLKRQMRWHWARLQELWTKTIEEF
jgi:hypothetical protein